MDLNILKMTNHPPYPVNNYYYGLFMIGELQQRKVHLVSRKKQVPFRMAIGIIITAQLLIGEASAARTIPPCEKKKDHSGWL